MITLLAKGLLGWERKSERDRYLIAYRVSGWAGRAVGLLPIPLRLLFGWFRSDKHMLGWHSYGHTYGALFRRWKYRPVKLLEIGIGGYGESLGGRSLEPAKDVNRAEVLDGADLNERLMVFAQQVTRLALKCNLIILWKGTNTEASKPVRVPESDVTQVTAAA